MVELNATSPDNSKVSAAEGISLVAFVTALATALVVFAIQIILFVFLKDKLARI